MNGTFEDSSDSTRRVDSGNEQSVYFVPLRWWKDAQDSMPSASNEKTGVLFTATQGSSSYASPMKLINNIFNSDLVFNLRREGDNQQNGENGDVGDSGRDFALVPGDMWLQALKCRDTLLKNTRLTMQNVSSESSSFVLQIKHSEAKNVVKEGRSFSAAEVDMADVYPIQLRLSVLRETNSLGVKISKKDNAAELFRRACKIFNFDSEQLGMWDFSGQTTLFFENDKSKVSNDCQRQTDQEMLLELQIYGLSDSIKCKEGKKDEASAHQSNGLNLSSSFWGKSGEAGSLGLTGLQNLGNTCFMNSALQCLAHTPRLVDYFLGDYGTEINQDNPLGMNGEIALAFGDLLRKLWAPGAATVAPRTFKAKLARFAPQFSGFNQHDSQELLAFLLDGLHEDLNRVKSKPYVEAKNGDGRPDDEVADEFWLNHLARNDSIIVDVCQGQYKSTLVCPICKKVSVTFDPFMYLSLPLPSTSMRTMTLTVTSADGNHLPIPLTVNVPKFGKFEDLQKALITACSLTDDETLLVAEIYNNRIIRFLEEPTDSLTLIRDGDQLVAYQLRKDVEIAPLIVFMHQKMEEQYINGKASPCWKAFGIPLVSRLCNVANGSDIHDLYFKLLSPFRLPAELAQDDSYSSENPIAELTDKQVAIENALVEEQNPTELKNAEPLKDTELRFYLTDDRGNFIDSEIMKTKSLEASRGSKRLNVVVRLPGKELEVYDTGRFSFLPEVFKSGPLTKQAQESVSLYKCLEAFLKDEPLGPDDMWYCPGCKEHRQAVKKLDLWRLPEILVIHLKRFSYSRFVKNKLETYVEFPLDDLDLSPYISYKNSQTSYRFVLFAISNHFGSMGGGHYTAFVHHGGDRWYDFDDSHVHPISLEKIKTSAAYVLFYRRLVEE